ncbi:hypothetical protein Tco_0664731 [Tanacetum coccineum]
MSNTNNTLQTRTSNVLHNAIMESGGKDRPPMLTPGNYGQWKSQGSLETTTEGFMETYKTVLDEIRSQLNAEAEAVQIIPTGIDNDIYSTVDTYLETNLYWEFGKFTSRDDESLKSYYLRFYKMVNELVRNKCDVTNHQVNVQILLQLQPKWQRFMTLVKQSQELKTISYHKLYDIMKQHQNEAIELRAEILARTTNPLSLTTTSCYQKGKAIVNSPTPAYTQELVMVVEDDEMLKEKDIDKHMALISLSFKKIYKPTNNNLITSSNTRTQVVQQSRIQCYSYKEYGHAAREYQADWRDDTDDEPKDQELEAHYMYMAQIQEVSPDVAKNFGPIFDEMLQKVQNDDDNYNVFTNEREHPEQPESVNDTYMVEHDDSNVVIDSLDMSNNGGEADQDDDDLAKELDLLASLIAKLKCEIDDRKNRNKFVESSNKTLVDKLKSEIEDFKNKNKSLESSNNHFKEANNELSKTNQLMFKDIKKFQNELN